MCSPVLTTDLQVRNTKTEKNVRATRCSVYTSPSLTRESPFPVCEDFSKKSHSHSLTICDLAIGDLAIGDLAIDCLAIGVHVLDSLEVRAATYFVKMMKKKKIVRNRFSSFGLTILILLR